MPITIQGFGTSWYGQCDYKPDGSYVTTEWIVVAFIPLIPLRSLRVCRERGAGQVARDLADSNPPFYMKETYAVHGKTDLNLKQVLRVYSFALLYCMWVYAAVWLLLKAQPDQVRLAVSGFFLALLLPASIPTVLRRWARGKPASPVYLVKQIVGYATQLVRELGSMPLSGLAVVVLLLAGMGAVVFGLMWVLNWISSLS